MFRNYISIAWRNMIRGKYYSLLNIGGLAIGICFTLLIGGFVLHEVFVNKHLKNADQQYILLSQWKKDNQGLAITSFGPLAKELKDRYPGLVADYYRFDGISTIVSRGTKGFRESIQIGDSSFLNMYGFQLLHGNSNGALDEPYTVVLLEDVAQKYFGKTDVVGQVLSIENFAGAKHDFKITGVLQRTGKNSIMNLTGEEKSGLYISEKNLTYFGRNMDWANRWIASYVELKQGVQPADLAGPLKELIKNNVAPDISDQVTAKLVPLTEYYLSDTNKSGTNGKIILALTLIAVFILAMTIINFLNMTIARSGPRLKEIGVRKVMGGQKREIIVQFLMESVFIVLLSTIIAFLLYGLVKAPFSRYLGYDLIQLTALPGYYVLFPVLFVLLLGLMAGIYPAFVLSAIKSTDALKKRLPVVKGKHYFRNALISFQFTASMIAFVAAIIISKQINYFLGNDLGYKIDHVVTAQVPRDWTPDGLIKMEAVRQQFETVAGVSDVSLSYEIPNGNNSGGVAIYKMQQDSTQAVAAELLQLDAHFAKVYQIPLIAGQFFDANHPEGRALVINATAARALGWQDPSKAYGKQVRLPGSPVIFTVKGVLADFHFGSMESKMPPLVMMDIHGTPIYRYLSFRLSGGHLANTIDAIQNKWDKLLPGAPFEFNFMDETVRKLYQSEIRLKKATYLGSFIAMVILLTGIIGLVALSIQHRTKEIGVRKVLGATPRQIIYLFLKDFSGIFLVAILIACPLGYILMRGWLNGYAYQIKFSPWPFIMAIAILSALTALLISLKTAGAARNNPVDSLRAE